tara:strand:+ start:11267 stop:12052 length:786 start_codon:yes stop_codon:yes gene_type:complete
LGAGDRLMYVSGCISRLRVSGCILRLSGRITQHKEVIKGNQLTQKTIINLVSNKVGFKATNLSESQPAARFDFLGQVNYHLSKSDPAENSVLYTQWLTSCFAIVIVHNEGKVDQSVKMWHFGRPPLSPQEFQKFNELAKLDDESFSKLYVSSGTEGNIAEDNINGSSNIKPFIKYYVTVLKEKGLPATFEKFFYFENHQELCLNGTLLCLCRKSTCVPVENPKFFYFDLDRLRLCSAVPKQLTSLEWFSDFSVDCFCKDSF